MLKKEVGKDLTCNQVTSTIMRIYNIPETNASDYKNVQRRVYDVINVLTALEIVRKHSHNIYYNPSNPYVSGGAADFSHKPPGTLHDFRLVSDYVEKKKKLEAVSLKLALLKESIDIYSRHTPSAGDSLTLQAPFLVVASTEPLKQSWNEQRTSLML